MNQLDSFIQAHIDDFMAGVDSDYLDQVDIGCNKKHIQKLLNSVCDAKRAKRKQPDGKYKYIRIYTLREDQIEYMKNVKPEAQEEQKPKKVVVKDLHNQLNTFIKDHLEDFKAGVNSQYLDQVDIGCCKNVIQKELQKVCEVKRIRNKLPDGKYKCSRIYKLKDCWICNYDGSKDVNLK